MIIEIGTSDFRTLAGKEEGIFVEPVKHYFDNLPECNKLNVAVSNREGTMIVYYVDPEKIGPLGLPQWVRGCNSVDQMHPTISKMVDEKKIPMDAIIADTVKVVRIKSIIDHYGVTNIDLLKIDTEGHDCVILNDYLDTIPLLPKVIQFEYNVLTDKGEANKLLHRLSELGYHCERVNDDYICRLK